VHCEVFQGKKFGVRPIERRHEDIFLDSAACATREAVGTVRALPPRQPGAAQAATHYRRGLAILWKNSDRFRLGG
jgi:hypothetical protein